MKPLPISLLIVFLAGCTSGQEVIQDLGQTREVVKESLGRSTESVVWRDLMIRELHRERLEIVTDAAEDAADNGDVETALQLLDEAETRLKAYDPFGDKARNIKRVIRVVRETEDELETPPENR